jgi:hypothetical protein
MLTENPKSKEPRPKPAGETKSEGESKAERRSNLLRVGEIVTNLGKLGWEIYSKVK